MADEIVTDYGINVPWKGYKLGHNQFVINFTRNGGPFDISAYTFTLEIFVPGGRDAKLTLNQGTQITNGAASGVLTSVLIQNSGQVVLTRGDYFYSLWYLFGGLKYSLYRGPLTLSREANPGSTVTIINQEVNLAGTFVNATVTLAGGTNYVLTSAGIISALGYTPADAADVSDSEVATEDYEASLGAGETFGQYSNGETIPSTGLTALQIIQLALGGYINPLFTSFAISGQATVVEVGTTISGSKTFIWAITLNSGTVSFIDIYDVTAAVALLASTANDGTQSATVTTNALTTNGETQVYKGILHDTDTVQNIDSANFTITARFLRFYGPAAASPTNSATVRALSSSAYHAGAGSFNLLTGTSQIKFVVALPPAVTITNVIDLDALNADITAQYVLTGTINVLDAGGTNRAYNIYEMNNGVAYSTSHRHQITTIT